jgi:PAS domain-containing protein
VGKEIRETVTFAPQNLILDPPFTRLDILSCRNLFIYLTPELQQKLLPLFHYSLNPGGILLLGSAESVGAATDLFATLDGKMRIFRRLDGALRTEPVGFPTPFFPARPREAEVLAAQPGAQKTAPNLQALAEQLLLQRYSPAAVLTNDKGDILYISGRTGKYLEPAAGKANWNIYAMAREGLRHELGSLFHQALRQKSAVTQASVKVGTNGGTEAVDLTVEPIQEPEALRGTVMVVFADVAAPPDAKLPGKARRTPATAAAQARTEQELRRATEELETTREQMQTSQEELKSANEELQSTNEELQSTNEELTTSKEEMQSMNEELQTVNHELKSKVDELSRANNDLRNLLDSTDVATLFLDEALNVRRFTAQMAKLVKLIPGDVDRPITDLSSDLVYPELCGDAREVLRTLLFKEKPVTTGDGRWFSVRIMPYRTIDNRIDGVVITFTDITAAKTLEATLRRSQPGREAGE